MFLSLTVYSYSTCLCAHRFPMSDQRAESPKDYRRSTERRLSVPQVSRDAEGEQPEPYAQRDPYAQPPYVPVYKYWDPYAAGGAGVSGTAGAHVGTYDNTANPAWMYGGGHYGDLSFAMGAAE